MRRHEFLLALHDRLQPRTYLEIGVGEGRSLALSRARSVAVDPAPRVAFPTREGVYIVKATSDEFFAREGALEPLLGRSGEPMPGDLAPESRDDAATRRSLDLVFIDGMHLVEYAVRDLTYVERYAAWWTVIVLDDVFPRSVEEAARQRRTQAWAGDVYKLHEVLGEYRPDLIGIPVDVSPTGLLILLGADPGNARLADHYHEILAQHVRPDPQQVPRSVIERHGAHDPDTVLAASLWDLIELGREGRMGRVEGGSALRWMMRELTLGHPEPDAGGRDGSLDAASPDGRTPGPRDGHG